MNQRGATIVESMVCMVLLCLVLFALLQIFQWTMAKMVCEYSSFYAAKARAVGFADTLVIKFARVAAIAASGQDTGTDKEPLQSQYSNLDEYRRQLTVRAQNYMQPSNSTINYEYWPDGRTIGGTTPVLYIDAPVDGNNTVNASVYIRNMSLLDPGVSAFINNVKNVDIPPGTSNMYNHSNLYLGSQ